MAAIIEASGHTTPKAVDLSWVTELLRVHRALVHFKLLFSFNLNTRLLSKALKNLSKSDAPPCTSHKDILFR